jgi:hypothetical protein
MIVKSASLIHARLRAALEEADAGIEFAEGTSWMRSWPA